MAGPARVWASRAARVRARVEAADGPGRIRRPGRGRPRSGPRAPGRSARHGRTAAGPVERASPRSNGRSARGRGHGRSSRSGAPGPGRTDRGRRARRTAGDRCRRDRSGLGPDRGRPGAGGRRSRGPWPGRESRADRPAMARAVAGASVAARRARPAGCGPAAVAPYGRCPPASAVADPCGSALGTARSRAEPPAARPSRRPRVAAARSLRSAVRSAGPPGHPVRRGPPAARPTGRPAARRVADGPVAIVVAARPVSHGPSPRSVASAGRRGCPRPRRRAPPARRAAGPMPPSRGPARAASRASSSAATSGSRPAVLVGQDAEHPVEVPQTSQRSAGVGRRQGPAFDPPVELADEVEQAPRGRRHVQVVVERRRRTRSRRCLERPRAASDRRTRSSR